MTKILIVDDSALMRRLLTDIIGSEADMEVRTARNGAEALSMIPDFDPAVVTLDINMPEMDGITCLSRIMVSHPRPVIMISSLTEAGAEITLQALGLGAVDFVQKPGGTISLSMDRVRAEILAKVRAAATSRVRRQTQRRAAAPEAPPRAPAQAEAPARSTAAPTGGRTGLVLVGVSTGGPGTLDEILPRLDADFPWPVLVAQHMPAAFTRVFARRLDEACRLRVVEVERPVTVERGTIYIAKGDCDLVLTRGPLGPRAAPVPSDPALLWHPSVDRLVRSALDVVPAQSLVAVQLTGMGNDGAAAMAELKRRGGRTIAQDEATSVVFGMPNELIKLGGASIVLPSDKIASRLANWLAAENRASAREVRHGTR